MHTNNGPFTAPGDLNSLQFNIDGHVFTLGQATGGSGQVLLDGTGDLTSIDYKTAAIGLWVTLQAVGIVYNYKDLATGHFSQGLITAVPHPGSADEGLASTPLPGAVWLFAGGLGLLGMLCPKRKSQNPLGCDREALGANCPGVFCWPTCKKNPRRSWDRVPWGAEPTAARKVEVLCVL